RKLPPFFDRRFGSVTVGNSCQVTDGAVALVVASEARAAALKKQPLGWIDAWAFVGLEPARMGLGPVHATAKLLAQANRRLEDFALVEMNEAFAVQVLACLEAFASPEFAARELERREPLGLLPL